MIFMNIFYTIGFLLLAVITTYTVVFTAKHKGPEFYAFLPAVWGQAVLSFVLVWRAQ